MCEEYGVKKQIVSDIKQKKYWKIMQLRFALMPRHERKVRLGEST